MARFAYDPAVLLSFPTVVGGVIHATGVTNVPTHPDLVEAFGAKQAAVRARIDNGHQRVAHASRPGGASSAASGSTRPSTAQRPRPSCAA